MKNRIISVSLIFISVIMLATVASSVPITKIGTGYDPEVYGNMVTWSDDAGSIHVYNLTTLKDTTISSSNSSCPDIYGNKMVWHDESSGKPRLTVYDIPSGARSYIMQKSLHFPVYALVRQMFVDLQQCNVCSYVGVII
jgi:beta propeller repeat protein